MFTTRTKILAAAGVVLLGVAAWSAKNDINSICDDCCCGCGIDDDTVQSIADAATDAVAEAIGGGNA